MMRPRFANKGVLSLQLESEDPHRRQRFREDGRYRNHSTTKHMVNHVDEEIFASAMTLLVKTQADFAQRIERESKRFRADIEANSERR